MDINHAFTSSRAAGAAVDADADTDTHDMPAGPARRRGVVGVCAAITSMVWAACTPVEPAGAATGELAHTCPGLVWDGDYRVRSRADLDDLARYATVTGTISIEGTSLTRLRGPACLTSVGGSLRIKGNRHLSRISGFKHLTRIGGDLLFLNNAGSVVVHGFADLGSIDGDVRFRGSEYRVEGLRALDSIGGVLGGEHGSLTVLGMNKLAQLGDVSFRQFRDVKLRGLRKLESVAGSVLFENVEGTIALADPSRLSSIGGNLIFSQAAVDGHMLAGFDHLRSLGGSFAIRDQADLTELDAFPVLEEIGDNVEIRQAPGLRSVRGFPVVQEIGGTVAIESMPDLRAVEGFSALGYVGGGLTLRDNDALRRVELDQLTTVVERLIIEDNASLTELRLPGLGTLEGEFVIADNPSLPRCEADEVLQRLVANGYEGAPRIEGNARGACQ